MFIYYLLFGQLKLSIQVDKLKKELETQNREKATLETRLNEAEKEIHNMNSKLVDVSSYFNIIQYLESFVISFFYLCMNVKCNECVSACDGVVH